nr:MAG TPA: hypothetical protein [Caudoviricetes sp.]
MIKEKALTCVRAFSEGGGMLLWEKINPYMHITFTRRVYQMVF